MLPRLSFVLGGARSGKSRFAEKLVTLHRKQKVYIATAQAFDGEMEARIVQHQRDRGEGWRDVDAPHDLVTALASVTIDEVALLDCATLWLSNRMLAEADLEAETDAVLKAVQECSGALVVVSNEVGQGIVPDNALARRFRDAQGRFNQRLAAASDLAVLVAAGLPLVLKGNLP